MLRDSPVRRQRWVRIAPHIIDTLLLASAIALTFTIGQYPFINAWLSAKVLALLLYIGLGFIAMKYGRNRNERLTAWIAAQLVFGYIVLVAHSHSPIPTTNAFSST